MCTSTTGINNGIFNSVFLTRYLSLYSCFLLLVFQDRGMMELLLKENGSESKGRLERELVGDVDRLAYL